MLKGTGASEGIGIGTVMRIEEVSLEYTPKQVEDPEQEIQRFQNAVREFIQETEAQAEALKASAGEKEAEIMMGHVSMIQDPYMTGEAERLIREGQCAEAAFESVSDMFINMFANVEDEMMRQSSRRHDPAGQGTDSFRHGRNQQGQYRGHHYGDRRKDLPFRHPRPRAGDPRCAQCGERHRDPEKW